MDRRGHRIVIDPKVRQVGFVTPATDPGVKGGVSERETIAAAPPAVVQSDPVVASPSPVIIPPPTRNLDLKAAPTHEQSSKKHLPALDVSAPLGSHNPPDSVLESFINPSTPIEKGLANVVSEEKFVKEKTQEEKIQKPFKERTSKAERRASQEAQRAAKAEAKLAGGGPRPPKSEADSHVNSHKEVKAVKPGSKEAPLQKKSSLGSEQKSVESTKSLDKKKKKDVPPPRMQFDDERQVEKAKKRALVEQTETKNRVELFRHLPQFVHGTMLPSLEAKYFGEDMMHPHRAIYKAGLQFLTGDVVGGNARCVVMLMAFREMIGDYTTPSGKIFNRDLTAKINSHVSFLTTCRPLAISMGNAIKFLKTTIVNLDGTLSEAEAKASLIVEINRFIQEKILYADKEIVKHAVQKIRDRDVCLTFGLSSVVEMILLQAHERGKKFRVVVVDSRPKLEGRGLLKRLLLEGIDCTYTCLNAVSYIMQEVTRVFLGAASVLSNGTVYSRVGTASVAMVAHAFSVPVMICCETYKFHERVQLDSITANELGDPNVLVEVCGRGNLKELQGWADDKHLQLLNLIYDATPSDYVSMIITELGMVPPTSVPVILREYRREPPL